MHTRMQVGIGFTLWLCVLPLIGHIFKNYSLLWTKIEDSFRWNSVCVWNHFRNLWQRKLAKFSTFEEKKFRKLYQRKRISIQTVIFSTDNIDACCGFKWIKMSLSAYNFMVCVCFVIVVTGKFDNNWGIFFQFN